MHESQSKKLGLALGQVGQGLGLGQIKQVPSNNGFGTFLS